MSLLDGMFELDEKKRIDIAGIQAHPWFNAPMRPEYTHALAKLNAEQDAIERKACSGLCAFVCSMFGQENDFVSQLTGISPIVRGVLQA
jgi:hypothetical protein